MLDEKFLSIDPTDDEATDEVVADEEVEEDVEGDIEAVNGVLKITRIRVNYHLKVPPGKEEDAKQALAVYLAGCPAAQSVMDCIEILDHLVMEQLF